MVIINGERQSGKTESLIFASYLTNTRILCPTMEMAFYIERRAQERGIPIVRPASVDVYLNSRMMVGEHLPILIDEATLKINGGSIVEKALCNYLHAPIFGITMSEPQTLKTLKSFERGGMNG